MIGILAGSFGEFKEWVELNVPQDKAREYYFIHSVDAVQGRFWIDYEIIGSFYNRVDAVAVLERLIPMIQPPGPKPPWHE